MDAKLVRLAKTVSHHLTEDMRRMDAGTQSNAAMWMKAQEELEEYINQRRFAHIQPKPYSIPERITDGPSSSSGTAGRQQPE